MIRKLFILSLALLLALCAAAEVSVTDAYGRTFTFDAPVTKIVALSAADCEMLCAIGGESLLVGIGEYCNYPESITALPVVASGAETNIEQILALMPQVIIASDMGMSLDTVNLLESCGIPVIESQAYSIEDTYSAIRVLGTLTGFDENAESVVAGMQSTFADISETALPSGKTVYFEVSPLEWGLWTAGKGTFMDELAAICGLENAFADVSSWAEISEEQVLLRDPDYIVTIAMYYGEGPTPVEEIMSRAGWSELKAVKNGNVIMLDSDSVSRPGPRLADAALALSLELD